MASSNSLPNVTVQKNVTELDSVHWWNKTAFLSLAIALWVIFLLTFAVATILVHSHPGPWPVELAVTRTVQGLPYWSWLPPMINFFGTFNNPTPSGIGIGIIVISILLMGWYRQAIFLALAVAASNGMNNILNRYVNRPRPSPALVHVDNMLKYYSFPSGHTNHVAIYYGFLLFLSFTGPVRRWRYRWALIPLQVFAALNILMIGFSRVYEGEHWAFDTLGGYLEGALWLTLFIFLYQWTTSTLERRRAKRLVEQPAITTQAHQATKETMREKSLETVHTVEEKSLESAQVVEKEVRPLELLLVKCKEDWIHHLAQALAFSYITAWVSGAILVAGIVGLIQGRFDTQVRQELMGTLWAGTPSQLSSFFDQTFGQALAVFTRSSPIAIGLTIVLAVLVASLFFSLLESCFDVIYHLPPRPFLRRHLVAIVMLFLFLVPVTIGIGVAEAPRLFLTLLHIVQPADTPRSNLALDIAGYVTSILISLLWYDFIYVLIPHRHITVPTLWHHIRHSWRGAVLATVTTQLFLLVFPFFTLHFLGSYIGQVAFAAILLLYFYLTTLILLFGAEVNAFFAEGIHLPKHDLITQASRDEYR